MEALKKELGERFLLQDNILLRVMAKPKSKDRAKFLGLLNKFANN